MLLSQTGRFGPVRSHKVNLVSGAIFALLDFRRRAIWGPDPSESPLLLMTGLVQRCTWTPADGLEERGAIQHPFCTADRAPTLYSMPSLVEFEGHKTLAVRIRSLVKASALSAIPHGWMLDGAALGPGADLSLAAEPECCHLHWTQR